ANAEPRAATARPELPRPPRDRCNEHRDSGTADPRTGYRAVHKRPDRYAGPGQLLTQVHPSALTQPDTLLRTSCIIETTSDLDAALGSSAAKQPEDISR